MLFRRLQVSLSENTWILVKSHYFCLSGFSHHILLKKNKSSIKVAVMGCEVNGPGEAKDADVGIAAGAGKAVIFRKGKKSKIVDEKDMLSTLMEEVRKAEKDSSTVGANEKGAAST